MRPHRLAGLAKHFCMMCPMVFSLVGRVMAILSRLLEGPEIRIPYATILIACVAILAGECLAAFEPPFVDRVISDQDAIGKALMDEVRREIEAIPEATRESEGIAILEEALPRFPSEATRQRVLVSIGELSAKLGRTNDAIDAFRRGLNLAADPVLSSACRTRLAELLSAQGRTEEAAAVLAVVPEPDADRLGVSDLPSDRTDDVFEAERKRIELLIDQGKDEEGFERLVRFSNVYPRHVREPLVLFERITAPMYLAGDYANAICWRRRAAEAFPHAAADPMFMSNAVVELQGAAQLDEAMKEPATAAMLAFVERFPDHGSTASFLKALGISSEMSGDLEAAKGYYERILASNLPSDDPQRRSATLDLARVTGVPVSAAPIDAPPSGPSAHPARRRWLILANALLVAAIAAWWLARRRGRV